MLDTVTYNNNNKGQFMRAPRIPPYGGITLFAIVSAAALEGAGGGRGGEVSEVIGILKKKYWEPSDVDNFFDFVRGLYESWNVILSQLTQFQIGALAHLLSSILILMCLSSVIAIIYSEYLLTYLKIEEKYPRIGRFIRIRRKFQQYYLFLNLTLIIITLLALIYANILALSI